MINATFKTQVQNRIDTFSLGTTPLADLLKIQTQSIGLGCNTTRLDAEIQARASAASGATALTDLSIMGLLLNNYKDQVYYQTPVAVNAGDKLYIDALGNVRTEQTPATAAVSGSYTNEFGPIAFKLMPEGLVGGDQMAANSNRFCVPLANGNWLVGHGYREGATTEPMMRIHVVNSTFDTVLSSTKLSLSASVSSVLWQLISLKETSANVFQLVYNGHNSDNLNANQFRYVSFAYNPVSHAITPGSMSAISTAGSWLTGTPFWSKSSDVFVAVPDALGQLFILNTVAPSLTAVAGVGTNGTGITRIDTVNLFGRVLVSGAPSLFKADTATLQSLPANLTADGCFGSAWTVRNIGPQRWICMSAGAVKLVYFSTDYTTATIYTLASSGLAAAVAYFQHGDTYTCYTGGATTLSNAWSFEWTGVAAPTSLITDLGLPSATAALTTDAFNGFPAISLSSRVTAMADRWSGGSTTQQMCMLRVNAAEYAGVEATWFATALTSAAASGFVEIKLQPNTQVAPGAVSTYKQKAHQNLWTTLRVRQGYARAYSSIPASTQSSYGPSAAEDLLSFRNADYASQNVSGVKAILKNFKYGFTGNVDIISPHRKDVLASAAGVVHFVNANRPLLMAAGPTGVAMVMQEPIQ